ncbi:hypothetical protein B0I35DRAFT_398821 [Stachybotrys elegans]|uniref:Histidine-specific methyltransferase SAM-dependent domain-containing protein n=1 Tax=Stachybotrys elegans TaxID=80388 RepID=A0A8K0WL20_9HYPO|nr:hypothetical protein B0I35DRAFT_398821 [Stachybotrys elegans]
MSSNADEKVIDIGGSRLSNSFHDQVLKALTNEMPYFPKELAYAAGMDKWLKVSEKSHQTSDEIGIIRATVERVVSELPDGTSIIDLGAANSPKYEPYVEEFGRQGKTCSYFPLDVSRDSLLKQVGNARDKFNGIHAVGLWGEIQDGMAYFQKIKGPKLYLVLGSILYNAPYKICIDRAKGFARVLEPVDRLVVGQDSPPASGDVAAVCSPYATAEYDAFLTSYLQAIQDVAGIEADPEAAWTVEHYTEAAMHSFKVSTTQRLVCTKLAGRVIEAGKSFIMFPSWKKSGEDVATLTNVAGLEIETLGKAENSDMYQYLIWAMDV